MKNKTTKKDENFMQKNIRSSLKNINWRLFISLLVMGLVPAIYTTVRTFFIGQLPGEYSYSIAGQLSWVNLIYEIINEATILPLFFFMGEIVKNKETFVNRLKTGLIVSASVYAVCAGAVIVFAEPLLRLMAASLDIIKESASYIRIESIANLFGVLCSFSGVALITIGKDKLIYLLTGLKLVLCTVFDTFLVSTLPISVNLGVNGVGVSNIFVNLILFALTLAMIKRSGYNILRKQKLSFTWLKDFTKIGGISGLESFVRNLVYMLMVSRMVNMVGEQGTYWVANNFIWGWLLLPVTQLGELIKQEVANSKETIKKNTLGYFTATGIICIIWFAAIPLYKPFMANILGYSDIDKLFSLVMVLLGFYVCYAIQNVFDMTFYGAGKTNYMLFESIVTNSIYYGCFFVAYITGVWTPTLTGIAIMFGCGNAFDAIVSGIAYRHFLKKEHINILQVNN